VVGGVAGSGPCIGCLGSGVSVILPKCCKIVTDCKVIRAAVALLSTSEQTG
jgi:hypothetical protein